MCSEGENGPTKKGHARWIRDKPDPLLRDLLKFSGVERYLNFRRRTFSVDEPSPLPEHGPFFSMDPEELRLRAEFLENHAGGGAYAEEFHKQADRLERLLIPETLEYQVMLEEFSDETKTFPVIYEVARRGDANATDLLGHKTLKYVEHLRMLAEQDNEVAAQFLARIAILATRALARVVQNNPSAVKPVAEREFAWPVLNSPHPHLKEVEPDWDMLGLGAAFPLQISKSARVNLRNPIGQIAWKLWSYIHQVRLASQERV